MSTCLGGRTQPHPKDGQSHWPQKASTKPRAGKPRPPAAEDDHTPALRWPRPSKQPDAPQGTTCVVWSDHLQRPGPPGQACSYPAWTASEEATDGDSSVSSGRLSGSSGGHKSCAPPHRPWKERPPQLLGSPRQHRKSSPRLEQLRDRIRAQAHRQASCASLGTSMPSSASHPHGASPPMPRRKVRKLRKPPPAPAYPDFGDLSAAERGAEDKASAGQDGEPCRVSQRQASVRREKSKSVRSSSCKREKAPNLSTRRAAKDKGDTEKVAAESPTARPRMPRPANMPHRAACDQIVTIQSAMAILQDLRQQIQTGLELAQDRHLRGAHEGRPSALWRQELAGRRHQGPWSAPDVKTPLSKSARAPTKRTHFSSERTGSFPAGPRWGTLARWESYPQRTWSAQGRDPTFQRPGSPPERLGCFPQRPWSASARQRAWATLEDGEAPARGPWHPVERPSPAAQRAWSASCVQRAGTAFKGSGSLLPPWGGKNPWPRPAQSSPRIAPGKENEARLPPPCPKPRGLLGHPHSPESLRQFMRQKALARRQQALEEKAAATRALELRDQRLQDVYKKQREAILGKAVPTKAFPVVSQTTPSIVTFVPHSAPSGGLEAPGCLGPRWSKVTSGMVLGDQEAPGSFCLCLDRALNRDETLQTGGPQEGREAAPLLMSTSSSWGPLELQDLTSHHTRPGLCIYLDPEEAARLGTAGPLHFRYKQARLQALETMASVLKQRIDSLTSKLLGSEAADTLEDLVSELPPPRPSTVPAAAPPVAPACPGALVPSSRGAPWGRADTPARPLPSPACFPDGEMLLWSPGWEQRQSVSPRGRPASKPRGFMEDARSELDKRLARNSASFQVLSPLARSSRRVPAPPDPTCGSLWLEEMPTARGVGSATPWTMQSCGLREPGGPRAGHFSDIQQKSLSFLQSLKLGQQKQERALALLRQQAELEVWETQKALDQLLRKHRLEKLMGRHATQARPGTASELVGLQLRGDPDAEIAWSTVTARLRSHPPLGRDAAAPSWGHEEGWERQARKSASAEPMQEGRPDQDLSQLPLARLYPPDNPTHQMPKQSPWEEELRAQHQAALLRLREKAEEEQVRWRPAWQEPRSRCLDSQRKDAAQVALAEKQQQALSNLEQKPSSRLEVKAAWEGGSETSQQPEGPAQGPSCTPTPHRPGSAPSHHPWSSPESPRVPPPVTTQQEGTPPRAASASDLHPQPPRPAWEEETPRADDWPDAQRGPVESNSLMGHGDPQTSPSPSSAEETQALTDSHAQSFQDRSRHTRGRGGPQSPREASVAEGGQNQVGADTGLDFAGSPVGEAPEMESQWSEEQRTKTCWQEDPQDPSSWQEAAQLTTCPAPAAAQEATPPAQHQGSPQPQLAAPSALGSPPESAPGTSSGSSVESSGGSPSCPSDQEFQKVFAFLVQLSESPISLSDWEAENAQDTDLGSSGESSSGDAGGLHRGRGQANWERPVGSRASPRHGCPSAMLGGPGSEPGWPPPLPDVPPASSASEVCSEVQGAKSLPEPGAGAQQATGRSWPAGGSSDAGDGGCPAWPPPPGALVGTGSVWSLTTELDTGKAKQTSPEAGCTAFPSNKSSCRGPDLSLSFPSGSLASKGAGFSKGGETGPPQASAGCPEGPWDADLSLPTNRKPPRAPPGAPSAPAALRAKSRAPGHGGSGALPALEEAPPTLGGSVLPETLSLGDTVLSCGSADLPCSTHRDTHLPPPPPTPPADSGATPNPSSEDFPSPPEDTMSPGGSLGPPEEGASISTFELPSLSEEGPPEVLSLGSQQSGLCLEASGQGRSLGDQLGESSSVGGNQAVGGQWSEPAGWLGSPSCREAGNALGRLPRLSVQLPGLSRVAHVAGGGLSRDGSTGRPGTWQGDPAPALDTGPCTDTHGVAGAGVVDLVSTELTRRILGDTLAVLSELGPPPGSPPTEELADTSRVPRPHPEATGQPWARPAF